MAWDGYFTFAGTELINAPRTQAYAEHAGAGWLKGCFDNNDLGPMTGDFEYTTPWQDPAPWTDPDVPESYGFFGVYPLDVTGLEDSTRVGTVVESISDGGTVGRIRHATKAVVFNVALVGNSDCAVDYGMRWLRRTLLGAACGIQASDACYGEDLCYLSCEPVLDWEGDDPDWTIDDCLHPIQRFLRRVVFNSGPTVTAKRNMTDGGAVWTATMTAVAGNPWEFGSETPIVAGFGLATDPYVCDPPGVVNMNGPIVDDSACLPSGHFPVFDPSCPAFIPPPDPPTVSLGCYVPPTNWKRRQFTIPESFIPLWGEVVPKIEIHAEGAPVRNLRLRFYADVDGDGTITLPTEDEPGENCAYCGDIVVSYVPEGETLVIDGSDQLVYVDSPGTIKRRADSLVFATDGTPFTWPVLSCGFAYIVTVDTAQTANLPSVNLSLYARAA